MIKRIILSITLFLYSNPLWAHEGHEIAEHHWDNPKCIMEVKHQALFMIAVVLVYFLVTYIKHDLSRGQNETE